jgi:hypothetical protein
MDIHMDDTISTLTSFIKEKYNPSLLLLYGSFCTGTETYESDIDIIVFSNIKSFIHESSYINGYILDGWIYPEDDINDLEKYIHILPCKILIDVNNIGNHIISTIEQERKNRTNKIDFTEKRQLDLWIEKMIKRSESNSIQGFYRYNWLIHDFPELYCKYLGYYFDGPIKTINFIKDNDIKIFKLFNMLKNTKSTEILKEIFLDISKRW